MRIMQYCVLFSLCCLAVCVDTLTTATTTRISSSSPIDWLIVGGGIHGVHMAARLLGVLDKQEDLVIVDDCSTLLEKWKTRTKATGMNFLRSSATFHLDLDKDSLIRFAARTKLNKKHQKLPFSKDYQRPELSLFNEHCEDVIAKYKISARHVQGRVTNIDLSCEESDLVRVQVQLMRPGEHAIEYLAKHVVLALGNGNPLYPQWVSSDLLETGRVKHLLDTAPNDGATPTNSNETIAIIGSGITAAHKALQLVRDGSAKVHLISRQKQLTEQQFDTHQDWMMDQVAIQQSLAMGGSGMPKRQRQWQQVECYRQRRQIITKERVAGTVTAAVNRGHDGLQYAIQQNRIQWHHSAQVNECKVIPHNEAGDGTSSSLRLQLRLSTDETIKVDQVLLATGFGKHLPALAKALIHQHDLPVSEYCGYPLVNSDLRWGNKSQLFVMGALAELEIGPSARNIAGARMASEQILNGVRNASKQNVTTRQQVMNL